MASGPSFSDLLAQLEAAHASEIQSVRDEYAVMAKRRGTSDHTGDCTFLQVRPQLPMQESCSLHMEQTMSNPTSPVSRSSKLSGYRRAATARADFALRPGWSRDLIWGTDDMDLTESCHDDNRREYGNMIMKSKFGETLRKKVEVRACIGYKDLTIFPNSNFRTGWDLMSLLLIIFDILTLPYVFAFDPEPSTTYTGMSWVSLIFWTSDMLQGPFLGYFDKGKYIHTRSRVFTHYLKTWFCVDVIVVTPEWISIIQGFRSQSDAVGQVSGLTKVFKSIRIVRVLRLLRLAKIKQLIEVLYDFTDGEVSFVMFNVTQLVLFLLILNHVLACAWYKVGVSTKSNGLSWVDGLLSNGGDSSSFYLYLTSMHWSLTQFTPASMDVSACNESERLFSIIVLFCAMIVFSSFVGSITNHITRLRTLVSDSTKQLWLLRRFLKQHNVSSNLSYRIKKHVEHKLNVENGRIAMTEIDVLSKLSAALSDELIYELHSDDICAHPFFHCLAHNMGLQVKLLHRLCQSALSLTDFAKHELVFSTGDEGKHMFIVQSGDLEYLRIGLAKVFVCVKPQQDDYESVRWIAEAVLWTAWRHRGELQVRHQCELLAISPVEFFDVMSKHPRSWLYATAYGEKFVEFLNTLEHITDAISSDSFFKDAADHANLVSVNDHIPDHMPEQQPDQTVENDPRQQDHTEDEQNVVPASL